MRISQWGEYGVLFSLYLAKKAEEGNPVVGAAELAAAQEIAVHYAQQILQRLRRGSVIASVRGPQGGYQLARSAKQISLLEILVASEGASFEVICETKPLDLPGCRNGHGPEKCPLRPVWFDLKKHINQFLAEYMLDDLVHAKSAFPQIDQWSK